MRVLFFLLATLLLALPSAAEEYLSPEHSTFADGHITWNDPSYPDDFDSFDNSHLIGLLKGAFAPDVLVRMVAQRIFEGRSDDWAVVLKRGKDGYRVVMFEPWETRAVVVINPPKPERGNVNQGKSPDDPSMANARCVVPVSNALGDQIVASWKAVLLRTRYDEHRTTSSVQWFHFAMPLSDQILAGETSVSNQGTAAGLLVGLAYRMQGFCLQGDPQATENLNRVLKALTERLDGEH
jgi:hypothetical protein